MEFQQEKTQLMQTPQKPGLLVRKSMGGVTSDLSQQNPPWKDKLLTNLE